MPSTLQLPYDVHRTPGTLAHFAAHAFELPAPDEAPDALLAAAFGILLHRYNAQPVIALGVARMTGAGAPRAGRLLELSLPPGATGLDVLAQAGAFLARLDSGGAEPRPGGAAITFLDGDGPVENPASADLHLVVARADGKLRATFLYHSGLFKRSTIERFEGHLRELSARLAVSAHAPISTLPLLAPAERRWIESVCTGGTRTSPAELVHRSFERRAADAPRAAAARFRDQTLSYGELNARANALARLLAARGIEAEARVVACLEPSLDVPVALLAILKAGGVYVPLDPSYPAARVRASLEDIGPRLILTRENLRAKVAAEGVPTLTFEDVERLAVGVSGENLDLAARPEQTAYIYYTSGTTGKPKGAAASQANLASYIRAAGEHYAIGASDVMPAIARFSFSISMFELMSPLAAGGTLILLERDHILDFARMARTLEETTIFHAGPSLLKNLIPHIKRHYSGFGAFAKVRHASSGGDMIAPEVLEGLKTIFFNAEVFVIYGCSEISCMGCTYPVPRSRSVERTYVGRPFENMAVRILDSALNLLPVGVVGEIHFAGDGIVKGYLNRPELTAERFIEHDGRRWYRTGDMGRLSEDGWVEILGRGDFQVKLRGIRIELGEVEHGLRRAPGVRDGAVMAKRRAGELALVAYVVMDGGSISTVHAHMTQHLPDYMVPSAYVVLESLPLNHNMKLDRHALPEPDEKAYRAALDPRFREPLTPTEKRLASLWSKLLGFERIGLDDHFFDLGGHSVLGLTLILDVESALGVKLTGLEVLRESLAGQAALCDARLGAPSAFAGPRAAAAPDNDFEAFHFGEGRGLYGVLSGAAGGSRTGDAVLICPSVGQEHLRAHFILQRLAKRLAERGVPALRFDYYGCGDSMGESADATCARWRRDIGEAYRELKRRTGAARITGVGVRLGAALLGEAAEDLELSRLVVWDPVRDGAQYLAELTATHDRFVRGWRWLFRAPPSCVEGGAELVGLACSAENLRQLAAVAFPPAGGRVPIKPLAAGFDAGWNDISRLNHLLPDVGVSARLADLATEQA